MVRGVGPRVPLRAADDGRPGVRAEPARADAQRRLPAPERPDPGLRVELRRRQPAGPRLGDAVRLQRRDSAARGDDDLDFLARRVQEAAAQLHLVGQPQGPRRAQRVRGRLPRARQHRRLRPQRRRSRPAAASSRPTARPGWRSSARTCSSSRSSSRRATRATRTSRSSSSEHFFWIAASMDQVGQTDDELWDEEDGFFYDVLRLPDGSATRLKVRSLVGLLPLCAVDRHLDADVLERFPTLAERRPRPPRAPPRPARDVRRSAGARASNGRRLLSVARRDEAPPRPRAHARRGALPRPARHPLALALAPRRTRTSSTSTGRSSASHYLPGRVRHGHVRRQLQLARAGLVPGQPADHPRAAPVLPLLRRRLHDRVPDRLRAAR